MPQILVIDDEDEDDYDDYRNAAIRRIPPRDPRSGPRPSSSPRSGSVVHVGGRQPARYDEPRSGTDTLRTIAGIASIVAPLLAAFRQVPPPPAMTGRADDDVGSQTAYMTALATHAKQSEQLNALATALARFSCTGLASAGA